MVLEFNGGLALALILPQILQLTDNVNAKINPFQIQVRMKRTPNGIRMEVVELPSGKIQSESDCVRLGDGASIQTIQPGTLGIEIRRT